MGTLNLTHSLTHSWLGHHFQGQGHQAVLLAAVLTCQAAAAVSVGMYWVWEPTASNVAVGSAARGASSPTEGGKGRGHIVVASCLQLVYEQVNIEITVLWWPAYLVLMQMWCWWFKWMLQCIRICWNEMSVIYELGCYVIGASKGRWEAWWFSPKVQWGAFSVQRQGWKTPKRTSWWCLDFVYALLEGLLGCHFLPWSHLNSDTRKWRVISWLLEILV